MTNDEAIELLERMKSRIANDLFRRALDLAIKALEERPTGEWIRIGKQKLFECSFCNGRNDKTNYCPNCGAKMKGENE